MAVNMGGGFVTQCINRRPRNERLQRRAEPLARGCCNEQSLSTTFTETGHEKLEKHCSRIGNRRVARWGCGCGLGARRERGRERWTWTLARPGRGGRPEARPIEGRPE